jgi:hypothetical protein
MTETAQIPGMLPASLVSTARASWPVPGGSDTPPPLAGFVASPFGPIIADVADRCLRPLYDTVPLTPAHGERTAIVLVTKYGDMATEAAVVGVVDGTRGTSPLLFFQSVPSAVLGVVASRWGLGGPVIVISPTGEPLTEGAALAELLIDDGAADQVLLVLAELATTEQEPDRAEAILVAPRRGDTEGAW